MQFAYGEEQELLRATTRRFLQDRHPIASLRPQLEADTTFDRDVWREGAGLGWTAMLVPEEFDGGSITGQPVVDLAALGEELGRQLYPGPVVETNVAADTIARHGADGVRKETLPGIARGDTVATWCLSSDGTAGPEAVTVELGASSRLDGVARFVPAAADADVLLVTARTQDAIVLAVVPARAAGISMRTMRALDVTRRFGEVTFAGVDVDEGSVIAAPDAVTRALNLATVIQATQAVGAAERVLEVTVQYAKDRIQFGRPIGSFQAIKHRLADLAVALEGARAAARYAALAVADDRPDRDEAVAVAGSFVGEAFARIAGEAIQLHGGIGFTWEHDAHLFLRRAKTDQALYGSPAWHRERLVSLLERAEA